MSNDSGGGRGGDGLGEAIPGLLILGAFGLGGWYVKDPVGFTTTFHVLWIILIISAIAAVAALIIWIIYACTRGAPKPLIYTSNKPVQYEASKPLAYEQPQT